MPGKLIARTPNHSSKIRMTLGILTPKRVGSYPALRIPKKKDQLSEASSFKMVLELCRYRQSIRILPSDSNSIEVYPSTSKTRKNIDPQKPNVLLGPWAHTYIPAKQLESSPPKKHKTQLLMVWLKVSAQT